VIAPARTGKANSNKNAVIKTDQTKRGSFSILWRQLRILIIVVIKLIAPRIDEIPAR